jgi:pSer/pThr/pTyr-binding forkhead associated (FHA) protein
MVVVGPSTGTISALDQQEFSIGRDPANRLPIPNPHMSMRHCVIRYENGKFKLVDLKSKNGTKVNNNPIDEHILQHGDRITIGDTTLKFVCQADASSESVKLVSTPLRLDRAVRLRQHDTLYLNPAKTAAIPRPARRERDLHLLFTIATKIAAIRDPQSLLWQIIETIFHGIPAQRGTILLGDAELADVKLAVSWDNKTGPTQTMQVGREVAREAMADCVSIMVSDPVTASMGRNAPTSVTGLLCAPLIAPTRVLGVIYLETSHPTIRFDAQHLELLTAAASLTALSLNSLSQVEAVTADNRRLRALLDDFTQPKSGKSFR